MPGRGPTPKDQIARPTNAKRRARGSWKTTEAVGWQHGPVPAPPKSLQPAARTAWKLWMGAWFASRWGVEDLPMLHLLVKLYDKCDRGSASAAEQSELRQLADNYGVTKKGQQDRRWRPPDEQPATLEDLYKGLYRGGRYDHLEVVEFGEETDSSTDPGA